MPIDRQQESIATAVNALEEGALAEAHHAFSCPGEVLLDLPFLRCDVSGFSFVKVFDQAIARQFE